MKPVRLVIATVMLGIGLLLAALVLAPGSLIRPAANYLLSGNSVEITFIEQLRLGWRGSSVATLRLRLAGIDFLVEDLAVTYQPRDLISQGRVVSVAMNRLEVTIPETPRLDEQPAAPPPSVIDLMAIAESLPFAQLAVTDLQIQSEFGASGTLTATTRPLQLQAELVAEARPDWRGDVRLRQTGNSQVTGTVSITQQQQPLVTAAWSVDQTNNQISLGVTSEIDLQTVQELPFVASVMGQVRLLDESLQLSAEVQAPVDLTSGPVLLTGFDFSAVDGALGWSWTDLPGRVDGELSTPLALTGALNTQTSTWDLNLEALQTSLSVAAEMLVSEASLTLGGIGIECDFQAQCTSSLETELRLPAWQVGDASGMNTLLTGGLELGWDSQGLSLRAPTLEVQLPRIEHELGAGSLELLVEDMEVQTADSVQVSLRATTRALDLDLPGVELTSPAISTQLEVATNQLRGTARLSLNERFSTSFAFRHGLDVQAGEMEFTVEPTQFNDANPLSSLIRLPDLNADIVAGSVSGGGELTWQRSASAWQVSGPLALNLEQLSGFAADVFFVGFSSPLQARLEEGNLRSAGLLPASIATLDIGLPMNRIDWRYGFDLQAGTVSIDSLRTGMLGGTVEIPAFVFDSNAAENRLQVVLSRLDLATIVDLANYPNLQVEGTVSGYLPLLISTDGVTLEHGLVSALNPGGSIRYTPAAGSSGNASVRLLNEALSNYRFQTLDAELEYSAGGDLDMAVQLRGSNPDMRGGQPINLNVTIADNIPTLLRSLQAGRLITERLEQRLNRQ